MQHTAHATALALDLDDKEMRADIVFETAARATRLSPRLDTSGSADCDMSRARESPEHTRCRVTR
jgi:hypothetical protein